MTTPQAAPKVLFIAGSGRSGSTLLDRIVGQVDGFFSAGEICRLWRESIARNRRCSCGAPMLDCTTWRRVLDHVHSDPAVPDVAEACALQARIMRPMGSPHRAALRPASFSNDLRNYARLLARLYDAIAEICEAQVVIDSSKEARHGLLLARMKSLDLRIVHLVRDSRAVVHSWSRKKFDPGRGDRMRRRGVVKTGLEWTLVNVLVDVLARSTDKRMLLRYDDLVFRPTDAVARILALAEEAASIPIEQDCRLHLSVAHLVAGNPVRFERGTIEIRADEEWRSKMSARNKTLVAALTWPMLHRYGFQSGRFLQRQNAQ